MTTTTTVRAWDAQFDQLRNMHPVPARFVDAREPIPVTVTLDWTTGREHLDTIALSWTRSLVRVRLDDPRCQFRGVWLAVGDVTRRRSAQPREP